jgi:hypothetical protein
MLDCYRQRGGWVDGSILPKHEREKDTGYDRRRQSIFSPAVYRYLIDTFDVLFSHNPTRVGHDELYEAFLGNAGQGSNLSRLLKRAVKVGEVQGSSWLVMDSFQFQPQAMDAMIAQRTYPFLELVNADKVVELAVDSLGNIIHFAYEFPAEQADGSVGTYKKVFKPGFVEIYDIDGVLMQTAELPSGVMPVIPVVPSGEILETYELPPSPTVGLYQGQFGITTTYSLIDESLYAQQFSILFLATKDDIKDVTLGTRNALRASEGSQASFISPSGTPVDLMLKRIESAFTMMIKTFANMLTNGDTQSGTAKVIDRQVGAQMLKDVASYLETVEYKIYELFCAYLARQPNADYTVTYFRDFDLTDIASYLASAADALQLPLSERAKRELKVDIVKKLFAHLDPEDLTEIVVAEGMDTEPPTEDKVDLVNEENNDGQPNS